MDFSHTALPQYKRRDLERAPWCYLLWGAPALLAFAAASAYHESVLSIAEAGILWTLSVAWIGIGCLINGATCGRVHCRIDGILFPLLAVVGVANIIGVISISWGLFWAVFFLILIAGFPPEWLWKKYS